MAENILSGKTALVTGAARGLGLAMARGLVDAGAQVVMADIDGDVVAEACKGFGLDAVAAARVLPVTMDVTDAVAITATVAKVAERFGGIDILVNDAVVGPERISPRFMLEKPKFWELDDALWLQMLKVNSFGPQLMARLLVPPMIARGWGRVVNVTTSTDTMYLAGAGAYGPSKAALEANTRIMAHDVAGTGVTVNVLIPGGPANTRMIDPAMGYPRDRLIQPEVMVTPLVWLCSAEADDISGMRFVATKWDGSLPRDARIAHAGAPVAWPQLGAQSARPPT